MLTVMTLPPHDYIRAYEQAIAALRDNPGNIDLQHRAVLSLAQSGAPEFAADEYARYGLDKVRGHEDIMALAGRLAKDQYLKRSGKDAAPYATLSTQKYAQAYDSTGGYYSGINAATMALMAGAAEADVSAHAGAIVDALPPAENLGPTDHYFIEATRAEGLLLMGKTRSAKQHLQSAIAFDPLNYTAHATTLKQFEMIAEKRGDSLPWLRDFTPPRPVHFAGHIDGGFTPDALNALPDTLIDSLQKHDIGFGYGAAAAGSDILIAEALLSQGAQLHITLPCPADRFAQHSVIPFGKDWPERYARILERAASVTIMAQNTPWPDAQVNRLAGQLAMGQAALNAAQFATLPAQMLIWNGAKGKSYTAVHAADWEATGRAQFIIEAPKPEGRNVDTSPAPASAFLMKTSRSRGPVRFDNAVDALIAATLEHAQNAEVNIALHIEIPGDNPNAVLDAMLKPATPRSLLMSESFAALLVLSSKDTAVSFAGIIDADDGAPVRAYAPG